MDDLIGRLVANVGVDRTAAERPSLSLRNFPEARTQGTMQSARSLAQSPSSVSSSDA
jgi:hypothetical protein